MVQFLLAIKGKIAPLRRPQPAGRRRKESMKVFLHTRSPQKRDWTNEMRDFARVPIIGEYLATSSSGPWYLVELVVHCPFDCEPDAEVYAVEVDHSEVQKSAFAG